MRVVGGRLRGRPLAAPSTHIGGLRPTSDRTRESIFNLLLHGGYANPPPPEGMRTLDLFAGTGALGIEALSRGAVHCVFVDTGPDARAIIRRNLDLLGLNGHSRIFRRDACKLGAPRGKPFDLTFLDPPYCTDLAARALRSVRDDSWLNPGGFAVIETEADTDFEGIAGWEILDRRLYGGTAVQVLRLEKN